MIKITDFIIMITVNFWILLYTTQKYADALVYRASLE